MPITLNLQDSYIVFQLAGASYAIRSEAIQQMEMVENITPLPNAPLYVEGVVMSRGQMIPALNLRARFGFPKIPFDVTSRLLVVRAAGRTVGLIVDSARDFVSLSAENIQPPPEAIAGLSGTYLKGIATVDKKLVLIINVEDVLNSVEASVLSPEKPEEELS